MKIYSFIILYLFLLFVGKTLKALENHPNKDIVSGAKKLSEYWELNVQKHQPTMEVRYDNLTLHIRKTSVKFFLKELGGNEVRTCFYKL